MTDSKASALMEAARKALAQRQAAQGAKRPEDGGKIKGYAKKATGKSRKTSKAK